MPTESRYREVLICVAGGSPAIITETIYALAKQEPPIYADEIRVITTAFGKRTIEKVKLDGVITELCQERRIPQLALTDESFIMLKNNEGAVLEDIRTLAENELAGDQIVAYLRNKAADPTVRLHCSIAGGRKTLGFFLGSALSFFGRSQDQLYHVLVSPEFENNPLFFYPKDMGIVCRMPDGTTATLNANSAQVELADLPFIKLNTFGGAKTYRELIARQQQKIDMTFAYPKLRMSLKEKAVWVGSHKINFDPSQLMLYVAFLRIKYNGCVKSDQECCRDCTDCYRDLYEFATKAFLTEMAEFYSAMNCGKNSYPQKLLLGKHKNGWFVASDKDGNPMAIEAQIEEIAKIRVVITRINKAISTQLGDNMLARFYHVVSDHKRNRCYGVMTEKSKISFED